MTISEMIEQLQRIANHANGHYVNPEGIIEVIESLKKLDLQVNRTESK